MRPVFISENGFGEIPPPGIRRQLSNVLVVFRGKPGSYKRHFFHDISSGLITHAAMFARPISNRVSAGWRIKDPAGCAFATFSGWLPR